MRDESLGELLQRLLVELIAEGVATGMLKYEAMKIEALQGAHETFSEDEDD